MQIISYDTLYNAPMTWSAAMKMLNSLNVTLTKQFFANCVMVHCLSISLSLFCKLENIFKCTQHYRSHHHHQLLELELHQTKEKIHVPTDR